MFAESISSENVQRWWRRKLGRRHRPGKLKQYCIGVIGQRSCIYFTRTRQSNQHCFNYLSISPPTYLPTKYPSNYLPSYLTTYLPIHLTIYLPSKGNKLFHTKLHCNDSNSWVIQNFVSLPLTNKLSTKIFFHCASVLDRSIANLFSGFVFNFHAHPLLNSLRLHYYIRLGVEFSRVEEHLLHMFKQTTTVTFKQIILFSLKIDFLKIAVPDPRYSCLVFAILDAHCKPGLFHSKTERN